MEGLRRMATVLGAEPHLWLALALVSGVLVPAALLLATRRGWSAGRSLAVGAAGAGLALVLVTSLNGFALVLPIRTDATCVYGAHLALHSARSRLDVLVYVPVAFFGALGLRRVLPVVLALGLLSVALEAVQLLLMGASCQSADVLRNVVGAALGAVIAAAVGGILTGGRSVTRRRPVADRGRSSARPAERV